MWLRNFRNFEQTTPALRACSSLLVLLCYKRFWPTKRATWKLPNQHTGYANAQRGDGVRIVTLGADAIRVGGTSSGVLVAIVRDCRLRPRGKNGSAQPQGTHRRRCIGWHGGEIRASLVLHNVQGRVPASVPDNPAR
jgi:hypothetical protein